LADDGTGSISSPLFGLKERSTNEGYHHTDCLWIATVKPTELWTATIHTPGQGNSQCHYTKVNKLTKFAQAINPILFIYLFYFILFYFFSGDVCGQQGTVRNGI
jgi:hypothetical protein